MDTSEAYIEMCEKTEEIQKLWNPEGGDFYAPPARDRVCFYFGLMDSDFIWLPRQDQLQEMIHRACLPHVLLDEFLSWEKQYQDNIVEQKGKVWIASSMEQLWLAFVMKEKYNKIWDGTDWVKGD